MAYPAAMAQTLIRILLHIVFSTKNRLELIDPTIEPELYRYMGAVCKNAVSPLLAVGGMADHVHLLVSLSKTLALADLLMDIKRDSAKWIKTKGQAYAGFHWQDGYGTFSIGESQRKAVIGYIGRQKEKHRTMTFQEEFIALLEKYQVEYDPRYIWR